MRNHSTSHSTSLFIVSTLLFLASIHSASTPLIQDNRSLQIAPPGTPVGVAAKPIQTTVAATQPVIQAQPAQIIQPAPRVLQKPKVVALPIVENTQFYTFYSKTPATQPKKRAKTLLLFAHTLKP